ncbi:multicomponent Na+:H+ antiporter subunit E [Prauserella aidingensis]|uniref:Na+/H+ antiporter subunit E n=1 Tax=Prauserella aidingensis TaxID=387890 RepID=UPI0020A4E834|nr:Na+/H+ antiporter subunit E [Prauserella aidingensis]MCP2253875.1 multicomponent Na+:H+ antiporter subunit E [Prauserella aidingensis]
MARRTMPGTRVAPSLLIWLVLVWLLLWGTFDVATLVYGTIVALAVLMLFPLPTHRWNIFRRPLRLVTVALYVVVDLFASALRFLTDIARGGGSVSAGIVAVPVLSDVDHVIASAANVVSLAPGKFVLQIDRPGGIWYVYVTGVRSREDADKAFDDVLDLQRAVVWAVAGDDEASTAGERAGEAKRRRRTGAALTPATAPGGAPPDGTATATPATATRDAAEPDPDEPPSDEHDAGGTGESGSRAEGAGDGTGGPPGEPRPGREDRRENR